MSRLPSIPASAPDNVLDIPFPLSTTVGALELGVLFAVFMFGILTVQLYIYFDRFPKDPVNFKVMVALVWMLDFGHTIAICHLLYIITVTQYGHPAALAILPKSLDASILLSGLIGPLEQGWFTFRLYKFTKTLPLPAICAILSLLRLGGSTALFVYSLEGRTIQEYATRMMWLIEAVVIVGAAVDAILALALCYYLSSWRTGGFQRTNKLVNQLMTWTVETGAITMFLLSVFGECFLTIHRAGALSLLLTFLTMKDNLVYIGFFCIMAKLFSNSLLFSLNARERFARICAEVISISSVAQDQETVKLVSPCDLEFPVPALGSPQRQHFPLRIRTNLSAFTTPTDRRQSEVTFVSSPTTHHNLSP